VLSLIETALLVGLLYSLFTIGLSISFRVINYPDLTLEGSVIFGGALCYNALNIGLDPYSALIVGMVGGALAGLFTAIQHLYFNVSKLLSGIITTAILYSINIRMLGGKSNVRFIDFDGLFKINNPSNNQYIDIAILFIVVLVVLMLLQRLFNTRLGMILRVLGDNKAFVISLGKSPKAVTILGLVLANAIIGLGGAILVQYKNTVDVNMSFGLLISALAAMMLGETIIQARNIWQYFTSNVLGTILYSLAIGIVLYSWGNRWEEIIMASDVRLVTGLLLLIPAIIIKLRKSRKYKIFKSDW